MTGAKRHLEALDGLRAVGILMVMLFHTSQSGTFHGGFLGVDLFFVLSGYLITTQLLAPSWSLPQFLIRRLARLWPALLVLALFVAADAATGGSSLRADIVSPLYIYNELVAYHAPLGDDTLVAHTWSLSIEAQFYVLWSLVMWWLHRRGASTQTVLKVAIGTALGSFAIKAFYLLALNDGWRAYFSTESRLDGLMTGATLAAALTLRRSRREPSPALPPLLIGSVVALAVCLFTVEHQSVSGLLIGGPIAILTASCIVVLTVTQPDHRLLAPLRWAPAVYIGQISYSLYLWHQPIFALITFHAHLHGAVLWVVEWVVAGGVAVASYRLVENPSRRWLYAKIGKRPAVIPA